MTIVCQTCHASYAIGDDRIGHGAFTRRCRRCGERRMIGGETLGGGGPPRGAATATRPWIDADEHTVFARPLPALRSHDSASGALPTAGGGARGGEPCEDAATERVVAVRAARASPDRASVNDEPTVRCALIEFFANSGATIDDIAPGDRAGVDAQRRGRTGLARAAGARASSSPGLGQPAGHQRGGGAFGGGATTDRSPAAALAGPGADERRSGTLVGRSKPSAQRWRLLLGAMIVIAIASLIATLSVIGSASADAASRSGESLRSSS